MRKVLMIGIVILGISVSDSFEKVSFAKEDGKGKTEFVTLEPIIVDVPGQEEKPSEVPSNVTVIRRSDIENSNAQNVPALLKNLEGVYFYDNSGTGTSARMNMRGFWGGMSTDQLVLIDGVPQNKGSDKLVDWDFISLDNVDRIEVIRGPASALYGDNAVSGVINIITKKADIVPEAKVFASYGNYNTQNYKVFATGPSDKVRCYFDADAKLTDSFREHCGYKSINVLGDLEFLADETQNLRLSVDCHAKKTGAYPWTITETQIKTDRSQARPGSEDDETSANKTSVNVTYHKNIDDIFDAEGMFYYRYEGSGSFYTSTSSASSTREQFSGENTYGLILRFKINPSICGLKNSFKTGIDLESDIFDYDQYRAPYKVRGSALYDYMVERNKVGFYIHDEINVFDPLKLIAGVRYDLVRFDFADRLNTGRSKKRGMSSVSPSCGIICSYREDSDFYANYGQAFKTPTPGQMFTYGGSSNPDLNPQIAENYELGMHHRFNEWIKANVSLYWMRIDNEIWYDYGTRQYDNCGKTSHKGVETVLNLKFMEKVTCFLNYTYTDARNESGDNKNKYMVNIPIHKGGAGITLDTDFGLKACLSGMWTGSSWIDESNDERLAGYITVDMKASYKYKWVSVFLGIDNLLNEIYNLHGFVNWQGVKFFAPGAGRTFTYGAEVKF